VVLLVQLPAPAQEPDRVALDDLRAQLRDGSRRAHALRRIELLPDGGVALLEDVLALNPLQPADRVLQKLIAKAPARLEQELVAALARPGDHVAMVEYLIRTAPDLGPHAPLIDSLLADPKQHSHRAVVAVTHAVLQGLPPPPSWLELLRSDDGRNGRQGLLNELQQHPVREDLWPHLAPMLRNPECHADVAAILLELGAAAAQHAEDLRIAIENCEPATAAGLADAAAQLAPATRACGPALVRCLGSDPLTVQRTLLALGELGNDDPPVLTAIAACLGRDDEGIRRDALIALGRLGAVAHRDAIAAAGQRGPAPVKALADLALGSFEVTSRPTATVLADLASMDRERAMLALRPLHSRAVAPQQLFDAAREVMQRNGRDWREQTMNRQIASALVRQATSGADATAREHALSMLGLRPGLQKYLPAQDLVRVLDSVRSGVEGDRLLGGILFDLRAPRHGLVAIAAIGTPAAHLEPTVAAFVHHPELAVRRAAVECLLAITGPDAVAAAKQRPDPWPRWLQLQKTQTNDAGVALALDAAMPSELRARALRQLTRSRAREWPATAGQLSSLLLHADQSLRRGALELCMNRQDLVLSPEGTVPRTIDANVLAAFAGGARDVRPSLAAFVRSHLELAWPTRLLQQVLEQDSSANGHPDTALSFLDTAALTQRALLELDRPGRELPTAWLQAFLTSHESLALHLLQRVCRTAKTPDAQARWQAPLAELMPTLADVLLPVADVWPDLFEAVAHTEAGRELLLQHCRDLPVERQLAVVATAGGDLRPFVGLLEQRVQQAMSRNKMPPEATLAILARLPWTDPGADLTTLRGLVEQLWKNPLDRPRLGPVLRVMGPAAHFAVDDLVSLLQTKDRSSGESAAAMLLAIGVRDPVVAWLHTLPPDLQWSAEDDALELAWADILTSRVLAALDADLAAAFERWYPHARRLPPERRGAVAMRLLAHAEASGALAVPVNAGWLAGDLGAAAEAQLAAFFARRKALGIRPDPLAETIAAPLLTNVPELAIEAMRDGLARVPQTLKECHIDRQAPIARQRVAAVAADLIEVVAACGDHVMTPAPIPEAIARRRREAGSADVHPNLGFYTGKILARAGAAPVDKILPLLDDASTRLFALVLLRELGAHAAAAAEAVARIAVKDGEPWQRDAARTLASLGPRGLLHLGDVVATRPQLLDFLVGALYSSDEDCVAAASALLQLHYLPNEETSRTLRERLQHCTDRKTSSFIMMLLLGSGQPASDQDWLKVADLEPAVLRRRAVQTLGKSATGPLQLGAIVELLDDTDASVRAAALETLLAKPERIKTCRRPLEEFAATAEAAVATRIREALSAPR